jgi:hypothetical protein
MNDPIPLRDGTTTHDPRLDRCVHFDERSRNFPIRALIPAVAKPRGYTWSVGVQLDQGHEGACTGFAVAHEAAARPVVVPNIDNALARKIYYRARQLDEWEGEDYEGSSVLAAVKAGQEAGLYGEYRWAFGLDDLILAVGYKGPAILGIPWYTGMMRPDSEGFLRVSGIVEGGHAILTNRVSVRRSVRARQRFFELYNSWGGEANGKVTDADMDRLLHERGEACIPVKRTKPKVDA